MCARQRMLPITGDVHIALRHHIAKRQGVFGIIGKLHLPLAFTIRGGGYIEPNMQHGYARALFVYFVTKVGLRLRASGK